MNDFEKMCVEKAKDNATYALAAALNNIADSLAYISVSLDSFIKEGIVIRKEDSE